MRTLTANASVISRKYQSVLHQSPVMEQAVQAVLQQESTWTDLQQLTLCVTAPVLIAYVQWVLDQAVARKIKQIYFLSRDGYVMHRIAQKLLAAAPRPERCSYFYCSRFSLRMAAYCLDEQAAYDRFFVRAAHLTARSVLERGAFTQAEREQIYADIAFPPETEQQPFDTAAFRQFCTQLRASAVFHDLLMARSREAYQMTKAYFQQEGLLNADVTCAIVDTGWTGTTQTVCQQLLHAMGGTGKLHGFYFGMLEYPQTGPDPDMHAYYFTPRTHMGRRLKFNHNVLECMCAAPHGMTIGYQDTGTKIEPIFQEERTLPTHQEAVRQQLACVMQVTDQLCRQAVPWQGDHTDLVQGLLVRMMYHPLPEEAAAMQAFQFCDDVTEGYFRTVSEVCTKQRLKSYLLHRRIYAYLHGGAKSAADLDSGLFWTYGSVALSPLKGKHWYRMQFWIWDFLRTAALQRKGN